MIRRGVSSGRSSGRVGRRRGVRPLASPPPGRFAVVASDYNPEIVRGLLDGALGELRRAGVPAGRIDVVRVPGAFEIPIAAARLAAAGRHAAIVTVGVVLRGETLHFDLVAAEAARGVAETARTSGVPTTFGVVAGTAAQARARAAAGPHNRGAEAARAAVETAALLRRLPRPKRGGR